MFKTRKVVIIGAGHVGSHVALALIQSGEADDIVLIDILKEKAAGQALDTAHDAVDRGDLEEARRQGHKLKGSAGSYGFGELARAAAALERAADAGNANAAAAARDWAAALLAKARLDWPV